MIVFPGKMLVLLPLDFAAFSKIYDPLVPRVLRGILLNKSWDFGMTTRDDRWLLPNYHKPKREIVVMFTD